MFFRLYIFPLVRVPKPWLHFLPWYVFTLTICLRIQLLHLPRAPGDRNSDKSMGTSTSGPGRPSDISHPTVSWRCKGWEAQSWVSLLCLSHRKITSVATSYDSLNQILCNNASSWWKEIKTLKYPSVCQHRLYFHLYCTGLREPTTDRTDWWCTEACKSTENTPYFVCGRYQNHKGVARCQSSKCLGEQVYHLQSLGLHHQP